MLHLLDVFKTRGAAQKRKEHQSDHDVDQGTRNRHDELLPWFVRHSLQPGHAADWQQRDVGRGNTECTRRQRMAKLVQQHASEECENEQHARNSGGCTANLVVRKSDPCQEE